MKSELAPEIVNPMLPITVTIIGAGGTGSLFAQHLARIAHAIHVLRGIRLVVTICDGDKISMHNVARQSFAENEVMLFKADTIVSRINRFYGLEWIAVNENFTFTAKDEKSDKLFYTLSSNFIISCVDSVDARADIKRFFDKGQGIKGHPEYFPHFWMDIGNAKTTGNVIVGSPSMGWPDVFQYENIFVPEKDEPSCTLAMSLNQQDMFINPTCALLAAKWLWECLSSKEIYWRGCFVNLETLLIRKLIIPNTDVTKESNSSGKPATVRKRQPGVNKANTVANKKRKGKTGNRSGRRQRTRS